MGERTAGGGAEISQFHSKRCDQHVLGCSEPQSGLCSAGRPGVHVAQKAEEESRCADRDEHAHVEFIAEISQFQVGALRAPSPAKP